MTIRRSASPRRSPPLEVLKENAFGDPAHLERIAEIIEGQRAADDDRGRFVTLFESLSLSATP